MIVQDLVNAATAAALDAAYHRAREAGFKAAAVGEAERLRVAAGGAVDRLRSDQGLGELRLDAANKPAEPIVDDPYALGGWAAQRDDARHLVHASIEVPVDRLEEALEILRSTAFTPDESTATTVVRDRDEAAKWLRDHARVMAAPDLPSGYCVVHGAGEDREVVPGAVGVKPSPYWVLRANDDRRREYVATAQVEVDGLVTELRRQAAEEVRERRIVEEAEPPAARVRAEAEEAVDRATAAHFLTERIADRMRTAAGQHAAAPYAGKLAVDLRDDCRGRGLPTSGTKPELVDRLVAHDLHRAGGTARV